MRSLAIAASLCLGLLLGAAAAATGQVSQEPSHPSHIHLGSCPAPGDVLVSLWDVSAEFLVDGEIIADPTAVAGLGPSFKGAVTDVEIPLVDLLESEHAIVVHRSAEDMDTYLVCGELRDLVIGTGEVPVALEPVGASTWSGVGLLRDDGDGNTTVSVFMLETGRPPDDPDDFEDAPIDDLDDDPDGVTRSLTTGTDGGAVTHRATVGGTEGTRGATGGTGAGTADETREGTAQD